MQTELNYNEDEDLQTLNPSMPCVLSSWIIFTIVKASWMSPLMSESTSTLAQMSPPPLPLWAYSIHLVIKINYGINFHLKNQKNLLKTHHEQYELSRNYPFLVPIQLAHHLNITSRNILIPKNCRCNISTCLMWMNNVYVLQFTPYYIDAYYRLLCVWEQYPSLKNLH
jgi:hypothetical protein